MDISVISARAQTKAALPLTRAVEPRKVGYTIEQFNKSFPLVKYETVLESFWNYYISKGEVSKNWFEKFLGYAQGAQDRASVGGIETDSMGMPTDRRLRREFSGTNERRDDVEDSNHIDRSHRTGPPRQPGDGDMPVP